MSENSHLANACTDARYDALRRLRTIPYYEAEPHFVSALGDSESKIRRFAVFELRKTTNPEVVNSIVACSQADPSPDVRVYATSVLGFIDMPSNVQPLIIALQDPDGRVRSAAAGALCRFNHPEMIEPLFEAIKDDSMYVRRNACRALINMGIGDRGTLSCIRALRGEDWGTFETRVMEYEHEVANGERPDEGMQPCSLEWMEREAERLVEESSGSDKPD
jgi:HEAT repeat protein